MIFKEEWQLRQAIVWFNCGRRSHDAEKIKNKVVVLVELTNGELGYQLQIDQVENVVSIAEAFKKFCLSNAKVRKWFKEDSVVAEVLKTIAPRKSAMPTR